jgi:FlaA1/EpsC-like NDP-sugar epimerase
MVKAGSGSMIAQRFRLIGLGLFIDSIIIFGAYTAAVALLLISDPDYVRFVIPYGHISIAGIVILVSLYLHGVYRRIWQRTSGYGVTIIISAVFVATLIISGAILLFQIRPLPLQVVLLAHVFALFGFVAIRYRSRLISGLNWRWHALFRKEFPDNPTRVVIVGAGESGQALAWRLKHRFTRHAHYRIIGFIDDDPKKQGLLVEGIPIIGTRHDIIRLAEQHHIDLIVVAIHNISGPNFREILTICEKTQALIKVAPDLHELVNARFNGSMLRDVQAEDLIGRAAITRHEGIDLAPVTNKTILITGAAGSIGSELSRQIMQYHPTTAILLDNNESGLHDLLVELQARHPAVHILPALVDVTSRRALEAVFARHKPQVIFHAAAYKHVPMLQHYPDEALRVNICGTRNLAELASAFHTERFVLISTDKAVNPSSVMGASKRLCELMLHAMSVSQDNHTIFAAVRFGNVLGSRGSVVPTFNRQIDSGGPVTVTHPEMTRYFMSIPEAVNLILHAACMTDGDDIYVLKMGEVVRIVELAERMIRLRGLRPNQDIAIEFTGIRVGEKLHEELFNEIETPNPTQHPQIMQVNRWRGDFDAARFWQALDSLLEMSFDSGSSALAAMTRIISPLTEPETSPHEPILPVSNGQYDA